MNAFPQWQTEILVSSYFDVMETEATRQDHVWLLARVCVYISNKIIYI